MLFFSVKAGVDVWARPERDTCGGLTADAATDIRAGRRRKVKRPKEKNKIHRI